MLLARAGRILTLASMKKGRGAGKVGESIASLTAGAGLVGTGEFSDCDISAKSKF